MGFDRHVQIQICKTPPSRSRLNLAESFPFMIEIDLFFAQVCKVNAATTLIFALHFFSQ